MLHKQRLFVASCLSLVTTSMVFSIRGDVEGAMSAAFHLTKEQMGSIWSPAFWAFTIAIFISGALVDVLGMRALHALSAIGYIVGVLLVLFAPFPAGPVDSIFGETGTLVLYSGFLIMGLSQGLVEGVINPLIATIYKEDKTHKLNVLHAWWPGGMIIGGLLAYALTGFGVSWQVKLACIMIPAVGYLFMVLTQEYPPTERVASQVSTVHAASRAARSSCCSSACG
jgi:MFS family permease